MATINSTSRPGYVYDVGSDTWIPLGVAPHTHSDALPGQTSNGGKFLQTDGTSASWQTVISKFSISDTTPPSSPEAGQVWFDSGSGNSYIYYNDGTSSQWVQLTSASTINLENTIVTLTGTQTLTNKTLTSPSINFALVDEPVLIAPEERINVSATAATGTINLDVKTSSVLYYTTNASGNFTLNIRGDGSNTLNSMLVVGDSITVTFLNTNGTSAFYQTGFTIDGSSVTPKWQGGSAPSSGNASSIDAYTATIIKVAATPTYVVLESQTRFT